MASNITDDLMQGPGHFAVCGAAAVNAYAKPRQTADLDVVVLSSESEKWARFLEQRGWSRAGDLSIGGWSFRHADGDELDVLIASEAWMTRAIQEAQTNLHGGLPVLPLPWLVLMKLNAGRTGDQADLTHMLGALSEDSFQTLLQTVESYLTEADVEDLSALYDLGHMEQA